MDDTTLDRRTFMQDAAGGAAGLAAALALPAAAAADGPDDDEHGHDHHARAAVPPKPIPGGVPLPTGLIHVFSPGDPSVTLPFSGLPLFGFDTEPGTITDFEGFSAVAFHAGSATGHDGTHFNLETDMRVFRGRYVDATGTRRFGTFAFI